MYTAVIRDVSPAFERCELTYVRREPIDLDRARAEHADYVSCLRELGCDTIELGAEPDLPDSVFVEDPAIVLDELAILTRPGAPSRRREPELLAATLSAFRRLERIVEPGTLEGGDVVRVGRRLFVGRSRRTNEAGAGQLAELVAPHGYHLTGVTVHGCLHLKSACTAISEGTLIVNRAWIDTAPLDGYELIDVPEEEPEAANVLMVGGTAVLPRHHPRVAELLAGEGVPVRTVDMTELKKAESGVTCSSLIFKTRTED